MIIIITKIFINDALIEAKNFQKLESVRSKISFEFTVTHDDYHDITTLLYKNDFMVKVPAEDLAFPATISKYSTSITNLYEQDAKGLFKLELIEINE